MWSLVSNEKKNTYQLIETLYYAERELTIEALAKQLNMSPRSVHTYLKKIGIIIEEAGGEIKINQLGNTLVLPSHIDIDYFQRYIIKKSEMFQLLELLFLNRELSGKEIAKELFTSSSTLNRLISRMKIELGNFGLSICSNPYRVVGDEFLIRRFYTAYFLEAYAPTEWPFDKRIYIHTTRIIKAIESQKRLNLHMVNYQKFQIFTAVSLLREFEGYTITSSKIIADFISEEAYSTVEMKVNEWLKSVALPKDEKSIYCKLYTVYSVYYFRSYLNNQLASSLDPDNVATLSEITEVLSDLEEMFNIATSDIQPLAQKIQELLYLYQFSSNTQCLKSYLVFKPRDYILLDYYKKDHPIFYNYSKQKLLELSKSRKQQLCEHNIEEILYIVFSRWKSLSNSLYNQYTRCKLLIHSSCGIQHAEIIADMLNSKIKNTCTISIYSEAFISKESLDKYDFDILVSSTSLEINIPEPVIALHRSQTNRKLQELLHQIDCVIERNRKSESEKVASQIKRQAAE